MTNILFNIFHLFSSASIDENCIEENFSEVKLSVSCNDLKIPSTNDLNKIQTNINYRDNINISIVQNDTTWNYVQEENDDFSHFLENCSTIQQEDAKIIKVSLTKSNKEQTISVYCFEYFIKYLNDLSFSGFLLKLNQVFDQHITFEIQDESFMEFSTKTIRFISSKQQSPKNISGNIDNLEKTKNLCHCDILTKYQFVPDDFYPITKTNTILYTMFFKISLLYSTLFLFDIVNIKDENIEFQINGYRTIRYDLKFNNIDISSCKIYFEIYCWVYDGGNIVDKIGLARNIISLNIDKDNLKLSDTTFEAIKSSYRIYQKENIKQYIETRNKISDQLIDLQNKADKIVENFINDYKKSFFSVVSFFISVIVIRVISKGDFNGGFTKEITILYMGFILISLLVMFFARWEINKQISRYTKSYDNLKQRYRDLLDESDINKILNFDKDFNENKQFIEKRRKGYTILWSISLLILFATTFILFVINNFDFKMLLARYFSKCALLIR